ncbi:MAG: hypothetical protein ACRDOI_27110 [Trebonia sp.]
MAIRVAEVQRDLDHARLVLLVRLQEIRDLHLESVRTVAGRWEQGLRGLLGVTSIAGIIGAPLAAGSLTFVTKLVVGILLGLVLATATTGLLMVMAAAYGSVRTIKPPASLPQLESLRENLARRASTQLLRGRILAVTALLLFAAAIAVGWTNPGGGGSYLRIETTDGVTYCGPQLGSPARTVAVDAPIEGRVQIPVGDVASIGIVGTCPPEEP